MNGKSKTIADLWEFEQKEIDENPNTLDLGDED